jgi:hypothetical protein
VFLQFQLEQARGAQPEKDDNFFVLHFGDKMFGGGFQRRALMSVGYELL